MKNTLKIMGLALLAGSLMLASCKKEEEEPVATVVVAFNGAQQTIGWHSCASNEKDFLMEAAKELKGEEVVLPYVYHQFDNYGGATKRTKWTNDDLEFYENEAVIMDSIEYGDWIEEETKSFNVDEFDANTLTLTYTNKSTMASMKDLSEGIDMDSCRRADINITVNDVKFTLDNSKAGFHKRHIAK